MLYVDEIQFYNFLVEHVIRISSVLYFENILSQVLLWATVPKVPYISITNVFVTDWNTMAMFGDLRWDEQNKIIIFYSIMITLHTDSWHVGSFVYITSALH